MSTNQENTFIRRSRRKQIDHFLIEEPTNHIQSIGDTPILEQIILQPTNIIQQNDYYFDMIYLLILIVFYTYYLTILLRENSNRFDEHEQFDYFDNYKREIPRLLWLKKGYRVY